MARKTKKPKPNNKNEGTLIQPYRVFLNSDTLKNYKPKYSPNIIVRKSGKFGKQVKGDIDLRKWAKS